MTVVDYVDIHQLVGRDFGKSSWMTVDQLRINRFAAATGDFQWIHVDAERARREIGATIAHGFLTLALLPVLSADLLKIRGTTRVLNYGTNRVRFAREVRSGSRVRLHQTVRAVEPKSNGIQMVSDCVIEIEASDKPACVAESVIIVFG